MTACSVTPALRAFQNGFAQALLAPNLSASATPQIAALAAQPGFAVYRNTVIKGCIDSLQANYPSIERLVGEQWLRAAAAIYVRAELPSHPMLLDYGAGFAQFLRAFAPAAEQPYLAGVAQLDRFWTEAHIAPDQPALQPAALALQKLERAIARPHSAARWAWFSELPIFTIWQRNHDAAFDHDAVPAIEWRSEGALITRPCDSVQAIQIDAAACAFLDACAAGRPLGQAAAAAVQADSAVDLAALMASLLDAGAFGSDSIAEESA